MSLFHRKKKDDATQDPQVAEAPKGKKSQHDTEDKVVDMSQPAEPKTPNPVPVGAQTAQSSPALNPNSNSFPEDLIKILGELPNLTFVNAGTFSREKPASPKNPPIEKLAEEIGLKLDEEEPKITYENLSGYAGAISEMRQRGIGMGNDAEYKELVEKLNARHGIPYAPSSDTFLFVSESREDALNFALATIGELDLPVIRMMMNGYDSDNPTLTVKVPKDQPTLNPQKTEFIGRGILLIEDIDLWPSPVVDAGDMGLPPFLMARMTKMAQETFALIHSAVCNPEVHVLVTASSDIDIEDIFLDLLGPLTPIYIDKPTAEERVEMWMDIVRDHPSLRVINMSQLVKYSANLWRADIYMAAMEAIDLAYRRGIRERRYVPISPDMIYDRLAAYLPLDSEEYKEIEAAALEDFATELQSLNGPDDL